MLYVVVVVAAVFYASLFLAWSTWHPAIDASSRTLASWRDVVLAVPDPTVLIVLKEVLMLAFIYCVFDALLSLFRRLRHRPARPSWKTYKLRDYSEPL